MYVVKTALRESFDNIHVGCRYNSIDETIRIETDRGENRVVKKCYLFLYTSRLCATSTIKIITSLSLISANSR